MDACGRLLLFGIGLSLASTLAHARETAVEIQRTEHHLGDGDGNQGTVFIQEFEVPRVLNDPHLELTFLAPGPNFENPPEIYLNGEPVGSIQPFFPTQEQAAPWQINPDGSRDYNHGFVVSFPVASLLRVGTNRFTIVSGRPDDDYEFSNVRITEAVPVASAPSSEPPMGAEARDTRCANVSPARYTRPVKVWRRCCLRRM